MSRNAYTSGVNTHPPNIVQSIFEFTVLIPF